MLQRPQIKAANYVIRGMQMDLAASRFSPEFAFKNMNMRITPIKNSTMSSLTNERGTEYNVIKGIGGVEYENMLRKWYNKICPYDIYKDYFYEDTVEVDEEGVDSGIFYGDEEEGDEPDGNVEGDIIGIPIGQGLINNELAIFTTEAEEEIDFPVNEGPYPDFPISKKYWLNELTGLKNNTDRIYKLWFNDKKLHGKLLYKGHLDFNSSSPIETIVYYENSNIRKVYWTDGINQPRFINIAAKDEELARWNNKSFDFVRSLRLDEIVKIEQKMDGGMFPAAAVQYVCTYFNLFGAESNIFYTSPIYYTTFADRGVSPEENTANSFKITIQNLDVNFDYVRIYSIVRTSIDNVPTVKLVSEMHLPLNKVNGTYQITYTDTNIGGTNVDPTELFYLGGEIITAYTMAQKDNTLFLGNIEQKRMSVPQNIKKAIRMFAMNVKSESNARYRSGQTSTFLTRLSFFTETPDEVKVGDKTFKIDEVNDLMCNDWVGWDEFYKNYNYTVSNEKYFQQGEIYRLGLQFQHYTGKWSDVVWIGDYENDKRVNGIKMYAMESGLLGYKWCGAKARLRFDNTGRGDGSANLFIMNMISLGYRKVRPVVVYPSVNERVNIAEGVACPTMFNIPDRVNGVCDNMASYVFRPIVKERTITGQVKEHRNMFPVKGEFEEKEVFASFENNESSYYNTDGSLYYNGTIDELRQKSNYYIDGSVITLNSPDIEFDDDLKNIDYANMRVDMIGTVRLVSTCNDEELQTSNIAGAYWKTIKVGDKIVRDVYFPTGYHKQKKWTYGGVVLNRFSYEDNIEDVRMESNDNGSYINEKVWNFLKTRYFMYKTFLWQQTGSINNSNTSTGESYSILKHKKKSYFSLGRTERFGYSVWNCKPSDIKIWDSDQNTIIKVNNKIYKGNEDKLVVPNEKYSKEVSYADALYEEDEKTTIRAARDNFWREVEENYWWCVRVYGPKGWVSYYDTMVITVSGIRRMIALSVPDEFKNPQNELKNWFDFYVYYAELYDTIESGRRPLTQTIKYDFIDEDSDHRVVSAYESLTLPVNVATIKELNDEFKDANRDINFDMTNSIYRNNPISMKFKSCPHFVIDLNESGSETYIALPQDDSSSDSSIKIVSNGTYEYKSGSPTKKYGTGTYLNLLKIIRPSYIVVNRFGGTSDYALSQNKFIPCGKAVDISDFKYDNEGKIERDNNGEALLKVKDKIEVVWEEGDVMMMKYECLKTYPFTLEDENSLTERIVFDVETRVNLAGRYDKNQYLDTNFTSLPTNMNILNNIYQQTNNFFQYSVEDYNKFNISEFPNTLTWTKTKISGETIDKWTNITMANTMDIDGDKGKITKLLNYNDKLLSFQDKGISQILYNEQMQMSTTEGVPIEIANNGKVSGRRVISETVGCNNKWSICATPNACYFVDDYTKNIWTINQNGLVSLSDQFGFHSWINNESKTLNPWEPLKFNNVVTYYDPKNKDVLFFTKYECLSYSEYINQFTSFYTYEYSPYFSPLEDRALFLNSYNSDEKKYTRTYKVWMQHEGDYNIFFGEYKPFYTVIVANPEEQLDKVFNNFEFRSDTWRKTTDEERQEGLPPWVLLEDTFDTFSIWNEYQKKREHMLYHQGMPSNLKKKFRVWRYEIPRDNRHFIDRIRNTWAYIKLEMDQYNTNKTILHDMAVYYYG